MKEITNKDIISHLKFIFFTVLLLISCWNISTQNLDSLNITNDSVYNLEDNLIDDGKITNDSGYHKEK